MEVECIKIRLKPNSIECAREWASQLNSQLDEVKTVLKSEGMAIESVFLERTPTADFLIYYLRAPNLARAREASKSSMHPIDVFHRSVMDQVVSHSTKLECLFDASVD